MWKKNPSADRKNCSKLALFTDELNQTSLHLHEASKTSGLLTWAGTHVKQNALTWPSSKKKKPGTHFLSAACVIRKPSLNHLSVNSQYCGTQVEKIYSSFHLFKHGKHLLLKELNFHKYHQTVIPSIPKYSSRASSVSHIPLIYSSADATEGSQGELI